jgi:hypothetical protein
MVRCYDMSEINNGYCWCGCGQQSVINTENDSSKGWIKGQPRKYIKGHRKTTPKINDRGYRYVYEPNHKRANNTGYIREHILVAEKAVGKSLPIHSVIHHVGDKLDNNNIVVCENQAYHDLIHQRERAYKACKHPTWRKCNYCKQWDDPNNLHIHSTSAANHKACKAQYDKLNRSNNRDAKLTLFV